MRHASLFSGIGGFDLAAEWMEWENVFHCEINPFCNKILKYYWPNAKEYTDIKKTDFSIWRGRVDILTGGFPCQPYSLAGNRKGKDDERHLWPEMLRAIREIKPKYVVGENVYGLFNWGGGMVFEEVCASLENEGYEVQAFVIPACAVDAPHRRDRIWFIAHASCDGYRSKRFRENRCAETKIERAQDKRKRIWHDFKRNGSQIIFTNSESRGNGRIQYQGPTTRTRKSNKSFRGLHRLSLLAHSNGIGLRRKSYGVGKSKLIGENIPTNNWENFPTQSPVCSGDDGLPDKLDGVTFSKWRNKSLEGFGNAIVPEIALEFFKAIEKTENLKTR